MGQRFAGFTKSTWSILGSFGFVGVSGLALWSVASRMTVEVCRFCLIS
jgi:hypothetical protein